MFGRSERAQRPCGSRAVWKHPFKMLHGVARGEMIVRWPTLRLSLRWSSSWSRRPRSRSMMVRRGRHSRRSRRSNLPREVVHSAAREHRDPQGARPAGSPLVRCPLPGRTGQPVDLSDRAEDAGTQWTVHGVAGGSDGPPSDTRAPARRARSSSTSKVFLQAGASKTVRLELDRSSFEVFDAASDTWKVLPGTYRIYVGTASRDLPLMQ